MHGSLNPFFRWKNKIDVITRLIKRGAMILTFKKLAKIVAYL